MKISCELGKEGGWRDGIAVGIGDASYSSRKKQKTRKCSKTDKKNLVWITPHDKFFLDLMVEQANLGKTISGGFTSEAWNIMS